MNPATIETQTIQTGNIEAPWLVACTGCGIFVRLYAGTCWRCGHDVPRPRRRPR